MEEMGESLLIKADEKLEKFNENHVLKALGLTAICDEDLERYFEPQLNEFLKK